MSADGEFELTGSDLLALAATFGGDETRTEYAVVYTLEGRTVVSGPYPYRSTADGLAKARRGVVVERTVYVTYRPWTVVAETGPAGGAAS